MPIAARWTNNLFHGARAAACCFLRIVQLLVALASVRHTSGETYYYQYRVRSPNMINVSSEAQCVSLCLSTQTCTAVSMSTFASLVCFLKHDGAIKLMQAKPCNTLVFHNVLVEGVHIPTPIHEWMLTSASDYSILNTGLLYTPVSVTYGLGNREYLPETSTLSSFFGKAVLDSDYNILLSQVQLNGTQSYSVFFLFKAQSPVEQLVIATVQWGTQVLSFIYNNNKVQVNSQFQNCEGSFSSSSFNISLFNWHSFACTYKSEGANVRVLYDGQVMLEANLSCAPSATNSNTNTSLNTKFKQQIAQNSYSVYCYLVFNVVLTQNDAFNLIEACSAGKISMTANGCAPSKLEYNGKHFYPYTSAFSFWQAFAHCESQNQLLMKIDSENEYKYLYDNYFSTTFDMYWNSAYGPKSDTDWTWLSDGSSFTTTSFPSYRISLDDCCPTPAMYHRMNNSLAFVDYGQDAAFFFMCYCQ